MDVDAGVQWLPDSAFIDQQSFNTERSPQTPRPTSHFSSTAVVAAAAAAASCAASIPTDPRQRRRKTPEIFQPTPFSSWNFTEPPLPVFIGGSPLQSTEAFLNSRGSGTNKDSTGLPSSPMSPRSVASWSVGGGGPVRWGAVEGSEEGLTGESPSRARERAARTILLREVGGESGKLINVHMADNCTTQY